MRIHKQLIEPGSCWIKWWLSPFPRSPGFFLDLGGSALRFTPEPGPAHIQAPSVDPGWIESCVRGLDDTVWLPLSQDDLQTDFLASVRERQVSRVVEVDASTSAIDAGVDSGDRSGSRSGSSVQEIPVFSPVDSLVAGDFVSAGCGPRGAVVAFPWIPGFTSGEERWGPFLASCVQNKVQNLLVMQPSIEDGAKRELARRCASDAQYSELFHVADDGNRDFADLRKAASSLGLALVCERPHGAELLKVRRNRQIAAALLVAADFGLDSHGAARSQEFYRGSNDARARTTRPVGDCRRGKPEGCRVVE